MSVAQNTVQNMGEDLTMMIGYSLFNDFMHKELGSLFPPTIDENGNEKMNIPLEVLSGGASYLFMSAMMELIRKEERYIQWIFAAGEAVIAILYARNKDWINAIKDKILPKKGFKASSKMKTLSEQQDTTNSFIGQVYQSMQVIMNGRNAGESVTNTIQAGTAQQEHALNREGANLKFAKANTDAFNQSILIKTITGTFTPADKMILQKVIGRSDFANVPLNIDELNQVREFMIIKDSNGKFVGLTEAFTSLINGLGFLKH